MGLGSSIGRAPPVDTRGGWSFNPSPGLSVIFKQGFFLKFLHATRQRKQDFIALV